MSRITLIALLLTVTPWACSHNPSGPPLKAVSALDLQRYLGVWYEIASFPQRFQKGCQATQATYTLRPDGDIDVLNACNKGALDGPMSEAHGHARRDADGEPGHLEVSFFWPFWAHYWVIDLAPDYSYAVVSHPSRDYLWILSRQRHMDAATYGRILAELATRGFDLGKLQKTRQPDVE